MRSRCVARVRQIVLIVAMFVGLVPTNALPVAVQQGGTAPIWACTEQGDPALRLVADQKDCDETERSVNLNDAQDPIAVCVRTSDQAILLRSTTDSSQPDDCDPRKIPGDAPTKLCMRSDGDLGLCADGAEPDVVVPPRSHAPAPDKPTKADDRSSEAPEDKERPTATDDRSPAPGDKERSRDRDADAPDDKGASRNRDSAAADDKGASRNRPLTAADDRGAGFGTDETTAATRAAETQPDLVLILADDMADADWRSLPKTRRLLPAVYPNFFLTQPICCPSRATLLTGQYPHNHGTLANNDGWASFEDNEQETLAVALQDGGYRTALIGKYLNGYPLSAGPRPGWDVWFARGDGGYYNYDIADGATVRHFGSAPQDYSTDVYRREAVKVIRRTSPDRPLFAVVAPNAPHGPAKVAEGYQGTCEGERVPRTPNFNARPVGKPAYLQGSSRLAESELDAFEQNRQCSLKSVDDLTVDIVKALEARGRPFSVVFMSDNGYLLAQHRYLGKSVPYEEAVRVTMRATGRGFPAGVHEGITGNIDLAPTFAALGGVPLTTPDGFDLRQNERQAILLESFGGSPVEEGDPGTQSAPSALADLPNPPQPPPWRAVRSSTAVYIETQEDGATFREFYDLRRDPYQLNNVASSDPRVPDYAAALNALRDCAGQACNQVAVQSGV